jgi:putative phage-type endonuclease
MKTDEQQKREEFLKRRRKGIGGSDVGAVLGVDRYRDAIDVFLDKTQPMEDIDNPNMERGRMMEAVVAVKWTMATGRRIKAGKFRKHRMYPWLLGNPDRIILAEGKAPYETIENGNGVLELKTANQYVFKQIKDQGLPQSYLLQLQHYMGVCGLEWGSFGVLCADPWEFLHFDVAFDPDLFEQVSYVLETFWKENVMRGIPPIPEPVDWSDCPKPAADEEVGILDTPSWEGAVDLYREAKNMLRLGKEYEDQAKELLKLEVDFEHGVYEGAGARVYYREQQGRKSFMQRELGVLQPLDPIAMATLLEKAGLDLDVIEVLFEEARLDLTRFEKRGKPFSTLRMYDSKDG